jgi:hypothetical protein
LLPERREAQWGDVQPLEAETMEKEGRKQLSRQQGLEGEAEEKPLLVLLHPLERRRLFALWLASVKSSAGLLLLSLQND